MPLIIQLSYERVITLPLDGQNTRLECIQVCGIKPLIQSILCSSRVYCYKVENMPFRFIYLLFFFLFFSLSLEDYSFTSCVYILVLIQLSQQGHLALTEELKGGGVVINLRRIPDFKLSGK